MKPKKPLTPLSRVALAKVMGRPMRGAVKKGQDHA